VAAESKGKKKKKVGAVKVGSKRMLLVYNPFSGDRTFKNNLDSYAEIFQDGGWQLTLLRSTNLGDIESNISKLRHDDFSAISIAGGDGTINTVINAMRIHNHNIPIGIIPSGTANDFAYCLKIPKDFEKACAKIAFGNETLVDLGMVNGHYFINVCGVGVFANISSQTDPNIKSTFGKLAYYFKGVERLPNLEPMPVRITGTNNIYEMEILLFLALNSAGTGGFDKLAPKAEIDDGILDFIAFPACPLIELPKLFIKVLRNELPEDPNILYFQDHRVKIELTKPEHPYETCDIDGEEGPKLPLVIENIQKGIKLIL